MLRDEMKVTCIKETTPAPVALENIEYRIAIHMQAGCPDTQFVHGGRKRIPARRHFPARVQVHILATGAFVLVSGGVYSRRKTLSRAVVALVCGVLAMTVVMVGCNLVFTPIFLGQTMGDVIALLMPAIIPFNLLKAGINAVVTFVVYKPIGTMLRIEPLPNGAKNNA